MNCRTRVTAGSSTLLLVALANAEVDLRIEVRDVLAEKGPEVTVVTPGSDVAEQGGRHVQEGLRSVACAKSGM